MKNKFRIVCFALFLAGFLVPVLAFAQTFERDLYFGLRRDQDIFKLQEFLTAEDLYDGPITGNFFSLTLEAVKKFQAREGIAPTAGYFGPKTRGKANEIIGVQIQASNQQAKEETGLIPQPTPSPSPSPTPSATPSPTSENTTSIQNQILALQQQIAQLLQQLQQTQQTTPTPSPTYVYIPVPIYTSLPAPAPSPSPSPSLSPSPSPSPLSSPTPATGTLTISLDSATNPAVQNYVKGTVNRLFLSLKFSAGSAEGIRVTQLTLTKTGNGSSTDISNIALYDGSGLAVSGNLIGSTVRFGANAAGLDSVGLFDLPASSTKTILVKADIASGATAGNAIGFKINEATDVKADGLVSRTDLPANSITFGSPTPSGNNHVVMAKGTLKVSLAPTTPLAQTYVKGSVREFTKISFTAGDGEDVLVSAVTVRMYRGSGTGTPASAGDVTNVKLLKADGTQFGTTIASPANTASFSGSLTVPGGTTVTLAVVGEVPTTTSASSVHIDLPGTGVIADDVASTGIYSTADIIETGSATGNLMTFGQGSLIVSIATTPTDQAVTLNTTGVTYVGFTLATGSIEDVRVSSIKLTRTSSGTGVSIDLANIALYNSDNMRLTAYKSLGNSDNVTFSASDFLNSLGIDVPKGQQVIVYVKADAPSTAVSGHLNALGIKATNDMTVSGLASGANLTAILTAGPGNSTGVNYKTSPATPDDLYEVSLISP